MNKRCDVPTIDITRPYEHRAVCPLCGSERNLPEGWQDHLRASMPTVEQALWDGVLRCRNGHPEEPMDVVAVVNHARPERDGTYLVHLVLDTDRRRAACTGDLWGGIPPNLPAGTGLRQCQVCRRWAPGA